MEGFILGHGWPGEGNGGGDAVHHGRGRCGGGSVWQAQGATSYISVNHQTESRKQDRVRL